MREKKKKRVSGTLKEDSDLVLREELRGGEKKNQDWVNFKGTKATESAKQKA